MQAKVGARMVVLARPLGGRPLDEPSNLNPRSFHSPLLHGKTPRKPSLAVELPYTPRTGQTALVQGIQDVQRAHRHGVFESPTGTGKTIAALVATLRSQQADGHRILYATRTNSQQAQVMHEHRQLRRAGTDPGLLVPLMGRRHHCPLLSEDERFKDGSAEELGRLCRDAKRKAVRAVETGRPVTGACPYYEGFLRDGTEPVEALLRSAASGKDLGQQVAAAGSCPHEALKTLLPKADVVVLPLVYLMDDALRNALTTWIGTGLDDCHVVFDEAHHLPNAARDHHSVRLTQVSIQRAVKEAEDHDDPVLGGQVLATSFLHALQRALQDMADEYILEDADDGKVPAGSMEERLMESLHIPSTIIERMAVDLETWGDIIRDAQQSKGRLPRSYLGNIGTFLRLWWLTRDAPYAHLIEGDPLALEAFLLEPASVLGWLHETASTVHMSGTLAPTSDHVRMTGLPEDTAQRALPSPFRGDQLAIRGVDGVHRRWQAHQDDPAHADRLQATACTILNGISGRTAIWFPSHAMLSDYMEEGFLHGLDRSIHMERSDMTQAELAGLLRRFTRDADPNALLLGVLGGRLTEGVDYPGDLLENVLVLGIPYPRPTARLQALIHHMDIVHDGQGWTLAVHHPVGRVLRQAVGRLVRGPEDHGTAYILDERVARFRTHLEGLQMVDWTAPLDATPLASEGFVTASKVAPSKPKSQLY